MANSVLRSIEVRPDSAAPRSSPSVSDGNRRLRCSDPRVLAVVLSVPLSLLVVAEADYGIIASSDGREIYFHRNSVADGGFDVLHKGQEVRFSETEGDKGPQATFVRPAGKHHLL